MTITISRNHFWDVYFEVEQTKQRYDPSDEFDILWQYPPQFGEGYSRDIQLREGLELLINNYQLHDRLIVKVPERQGCIVYDFCLSGGGEGWDMHTKSHFTWKGGQYQLAGNGKFDNRRYAFSGTLEHQFSQNWSLRNTFFSRWNSVQRALPNVFNFDEITGEYTRRILTTDDSYHNLANNLDIVGNFKTGSVDHKLLLGFQFAREINNRRIFAGEEGSYPSLNIFNPIYSSVRFRYDEFPFTAVRRDITNTTYGVYLQDQIAFTDNLKLVLGGRYDIYQQDTSDRLTSVDSSQTDTAFSPSSPPRKLCLVLGNAGKLLNMGGVRVVSWQKNTLWI